MISGVFGVSGRRLLERLVEQGFVDKKEVGRRVHERMNAKVDDVSDALFGTITEHQIDLIRMCWEHIMFLESQITSIEENIDALSRRS